MLVFGSELHVLTFIFIVLELMMLTFQLWYCFAWPKDKDRMWYLILLALLILYNITGGLFPDPKVKVISERLQNIIAYGSGFLMAAYFPFYFYKVFRLPHLRFHALYGVPLFLLLPYLIFFVIGYSINGKLDFAIRYGMVVPFFYSLVIAITMLIAIRKELKFKDELLAFRRNQMVWLYVAIVPWICLTVITYFKMAQWLEALVTNLGFVIITLLYMRRSAMETRAAQERLLLMDHSRMSVFQQKSESVHLTKREMQVAELLCQGMTYKQIAEELFISENTVDTHVQNIFFKTGVNRKIELQKILGLGG